MPQQREVVIVADDGTEHVFPPGFDPKRAAAIVRGRASQPDGVSTMDAATAAVSGLWDYINPVSMVRAAAQTVAHPIETARGVLAAQDVPRQRGVEAFQEGDYLGALRHFVDYAIPVLGPQLDEASNKTAQGPGTRDFYEGVGNTLGVGAQIVAPELLRRAPSVTVRAARNPNPAEASAVEFAQREGIPVDAGTATGNRFLKGTQAMVDTSPLGAGVAARGRQASANALKATADRLAQRAHPAAVTPEQAGEAARTAVAGKVRQFHGEANTAYDLVRQAEANPANQRGVTVTQQGQVAGGGSIPITTTQQMALPVDLRATKAALRPVYDRMARQLPITVQRSSPGFTAIKNIMDGPDYVPLSVADADLGTIKGLARGADLPELRDMSQGLAAQAVKEFDKAVQATASQAGPDVLSALKEGRAATVAKYNAGDLLRRLRSEPVQTFRQMIYQKDAGIAQLRQVAKLAPKEMPKIGRAYLEDLIDRATQRGGFGRADSILSEWEKLGPETRRLLFKDAQLVKDLDDFFLLAQKVAENPNPSGTALTMNSLGQLSLMFTHPTTGVPLVLGSGALAKLLRSPRVVRLLVRGLKVPAGNRAAAATVSAEVLKAAHEMGARAVPAAAEGGTSGQSAQ